MAERRMYRDWARGEGFVATIVVVDESDLLILAREDVSVPAATLVHTARAELEAYLRRDEGFGTALAPHAPLADAPPIARCMAEAAARFGVGPMAAVAGAVAAYVGEALANELGDVVVENGGDIFVSSAHPVTFGFYAGRDSPFTGKLRFCVRGMGKRFGVCTSSGTVGHSLSFGRADAVTIVAASAPDADAAATAMANRVQTKEDIDRVIDEAKRYKEIKGIIAAKEDRIGLWGAVEII